MNKPDVNKLMILVKIKIILRGNNKIYYTLIKFIT